MDTKVINNPQESIKDNQEIIPNESIQAETPEPQKRGKGRPKGSKNKPKRKKTRYNPAVIAKMRKERLKGANGADTLRAGGYAESTAIGEVGRSPTLKFVDKSIEAELLAKNMDADYFIKKRERYINKCEEKGDFTNVFRGTEGQERLVGLDNDKVKTLINITNVPTNEEEFTQRILDRLKSVKI